MKEAIKWIAILIVAIWGVKSFVNCGGDNGGRMDLSKTNVLILEPTSRCSYSSMTVTLYGDGTDHVEGTYQSGQSFKDDGNWSLVTGSYHDQEQKAITFDITNGFGGTIMPNLDFYSGSTSDAADIAQQKEFLTPSGRMRIK